MVVTPSSMLPIGTPAPAFNLPDTVSGETLSLDQLKSDKATVIMFICNHCPYVQHIHHKLVDITNAYQSKGIQFIAISANDVEKYPEDGPDKMREMAETLGFLFPYLYDESQDVAKAYHAECTPDFFIFDHDLKCVYRGCFDESSPGNDIPVTGDKLGAALDAILAGEPVANDQKPSIGCNIKWK